MLSDAQHSASRLNLERPFLSVDEVNGIFSGRIRQTPSVEKTVRKLVFATTHETSAPPRAQTACDTADQNRDTSGHLGLDPVGIFTVTITN